MSSRLFIPYSALISPDAKELIINQPARCSHCNTEPAVFFETHQVTLKANRIPHRQIGRKYRNEKRLLVRLPLCEACYLNDYLLTPDCYAHDNTPMGTQARRNGRLADVAGLLAALSIILITPFVPAIGLLSTLKTNWYFLLIVGLVMLGIIWVLQKMSQRQVRKSLAALRPGGSKFPRAQVWTNPIEGDFEPANTILEINLENVNWADDCSHLNAWRIELNR